VESVCKQPDFQELAKAQEEDAELKKLLKTETALQLERIAIPGSTERLICDTSTKILRPFVTAAFRRQIFDSLHNLAHPEIKATVKMITQRYVWPDIKKDCRKWAQACIQCQKSKIHRHTIAPTGNFTAPTQRF